MRVTAHLEADAIYKFILPDDAGQSPNCAMIANKAKTRLDLVELLPHSPFLYKRCDWKHDLRGMPVIVVNRVRGGGRPAVVVERLPCIGLTSKRGKLLLETSMRIRWPFLKIIAVGYMSIEI